jgi:hypothetical protein
MGLPITPSPMNPIVAMPTSESPLDTFHAAGNIIR